MRGVAPFFFSSTRSVRCVGVVGVGFVGLEVGGWWVKGWGGFSAAARDALSERHTVSIHTSILVNPAELAKLQAASRTGGKGAHRRKVNKKPSPTPTKSAAEGGSDKKLNATRKKLGRGAQPMTGYEEVNMFKN